MTIREKKVLIIGNNGKSDELESRLNEYSLKTYRYAGRVQDIEAKVDLCQPDVILIFGSDKLIKTEEDFFREFIPDFSNPPVFVAGIKEKETIQRALEVGADIIQNPSGKNILDIIALKVRNFFATMAKFENKNWLSLINETFNDSALSDDEAFMKEAIEAIANNIERYNFSVSDLAFKTNLSERQLYRRINRLTNYTPAALIREMRLQRACKLLTQKKVKTKKELANRVGYRSVSYFLAAYEGRFNECIEL